MPEATLKENEFRDCFAYFLVIPTRWMDNDIYGHVNNVVYYAYFDTLITRYLIDRASFDIHAGVVAPFTVENMCRFHRSLAFPEIIDGGLRVARLGRSSVRYEIGLFTQGRDDAAATGYFVDVFVDRETNKSVSIPENVRAALDELMLERP